MPHPTPVDPSLRRDIVLDITMGKGRNAIARDRHVSAGLVSKIARQERLWFDRCTQTATATQAQQIDQYAERVRRSEELDAAWDREITKNARRAVDSSPRLRRIEYAQYNLNRHCSPAYRV